jgi:hypothetical protein
MRDETLWSKKMRVERMSAGIIAAKTAQTGTDVGDTTHGLPEVV